MAASSLKAHSLGSYQVIRKLGAGGMAEVFLAAHHMAGDVERLVVVKAMLPHLADDDRFVQMFMREARIAALLSHPNIVQIHDVSVIEGRPCIIMEFLRGRDLWHVLRRLARQRERIRPVAAAAIVAQAASGLEYAHKKRDDKGRRIDLVHRDISPHNLFLTRDGHVRVLDFGIAKSRYQQQQTQSGVLKGKLPYMAPEQARGKQVDGRTDEFALGVVLWEMLAGRRLFARDDPYQTLHSLFHMDIVPPSELDPAIPAELDAICLRALARDPDARFESCEDLANALRDWLRRASTEREPAVVSAALEQAIPSAEDASFYGFDPDSTATAVHLPEEDETSDIGTDPEMHEIFDRDGTPSRSGIARTVVHDVPTAIADEGAEATPHVVEATPHVFDAGAPPRAGLSRGTVTLVAVVLLGFLAAGVGAAVAVFGAEPEQAADVHPSAPPPPPPEPVPAPAPPAPAEIAIRFADVPPDVRLEVDGAALGGTTLDTFASDEVRRVRAFVRDREVWRYDGIFRRSTTVTLPELGATDEAPAPSRPSGPSRRAARRPRRTEPAAMDAPAMRSSPRLDNDLDLGYP